MNISITEEQFTKAFKLLTESSKKKWQVSTDRAIAKKVGASINKDKTIAQIEELLTKEITETEFLARLNTL